MMYIAKWGREEDRARMIAKVRKVAKYTGVDESFDYYCEIIEIIQMVPHAVYLIYVGQELAFKNSELTPTEDPNDVLKEML